MVFRKTKELIYKTSVRTRVLHRGSAGRGTGPRREDRRIRERAHENGSIAGSVLVARDGKVIHAAGYGLANREHEVPNGTKTKFRLGSISKQFTAAAILKLEEQGRLSTADTLCKYLESCPDAWSRITIHQLLTHTAGVPNFTSFPDYRQTWSLQSRPEQTVLRFKDKPLEFEPGSKMSYSNSGYILLAVVIEKAAGMKFEDYLTSSIFAPLGMKDTGNDSHIEIIRNRADGYGKQGDRFVNSDYLAMTIPIGAGSLYSTVEDLLIWDQALYGEKLLTKKSLARMYTPALQGYAYGWAIGKQHERRTVAHGGGINGFSTAITRFPEDRTLVVVLSNLMSAPAGKIAHDLAAIVFNAKYEAPRERVVIKVDPKVYDAYAGKYEIAPSFIMSVTREGDRLMTQATGQAKVEVFPESETKFFLKVVDAQLTFVKGADGKVTHLILHQGGNREAKKIE